MTTTPTDDDVLFVPEQHPRADGASLRLRLSDCRSDAEEFRATDGQSLAAGAEAALARYAQRHRDAWLAGPQETRREHGAERLSLSLHVHGGRDVWTEPRRPIHLEPHEFGPLGGALGGPPVQCLVTPIALRTLRDETWMAWWEYCVHADAWSRALRGLAARVSHHLVPPARSGWTF